MGEHNEIGKRIRPVAGAGLRGGSPEHMRAQLTLIRVVLGLSPIHDPVEAVRVLYEQGRPAFEATRGPFRDDAADWGK